MQKFIAPISLIYRIIQSKRKLFTLLGYAKDVHCIRKVKERKNPGDNMQCMHDLIHYNLILIVTPFDWLNKILIHIYSV